MRRFWILALLAACFLIAGCDTHRPSTDHMPEQYRHLMQRVVLFQGNVSTAGSGNILDLGTTDVLVTPGPAEAEERVNLASGGQLPIRRTHRVEIPVSRSELAAFGQYMARVDGCGETQVLMMGRGENGAESWAWFEPATLTANSPAADAGGMGRIVLSMQTRVFDAAIGRGDLLSMTAWEGATRESGDLVYDSRPGYEGPAWSTTAGAPDFDGAYDAGTANVTIPAPIEGAELSLYAEAGSLSGEIVYLDWLADVISTDTSPESSIVPEYTWAIQVDVTSTDGRPRLDVLAPGSALGVRRGDTVTGCDDRATAPFWLDVIREDGPILADITSLTGTGDPLTNVDIVVEGNVEFTRAIVDSPIPAIDDAYPILEVGETFTYVYNTGSKTVTANSVVYDSNADETTIGIDESISLSESVPVRVEIPFTLPPPLGS